MRLVDVAELVAKLFTPQNPSRPVLRFCDGVAVVLMDVSVLDNDQR